MSELLDTINNYKKLLDANDAEQRRVNLLRGEAQELEIQITKAKSLLAETIKQTEEIHAKALKEIKQAKDNADRIFKQENDRLEGKYQTSNIREKNCDEKEAKQRQTGLEQAQRTQDLDEREAKLNLKEAAIKNEKQELFQIKEANETIAFKNQQEREKIEADNKAIAQEKIDIKDQLHLIKTGVEELKQEQEKNQKILSQVKVKEKENEAEAKRLEKLSIDIGRQQKELEMRIAVEEKLKKDNSDKERALQALKMEMDFKIAKIEKGKK